jgi:hypothetical protein
MSPAEETRQILLLKVEPRLRALQGHTNLRLSLRTQAHHSSRRELEQCNLQFHSASAVYFHTEERALSHSISI